MPYDWKNSFSESSNSAVFTIARVSFDNLQPILCLWQIIDSNFLYGVATSLTFILLVSNPYAFIELLYWFERRWYRLRHYLEGTQNRFSRFFRRIQDVRIPYIWSRNLRIYGGRTVVFNMGIWHLFNMVSAFYSSVESTSFHTRISYFTSFLFQLIFLCASGYQQNGRTRFRTNRFSEFAFPMIILQCFPHAWNRIYIVPIAVSYISLALQYRDMLRPYSSTDARPRNGEANRIPWRILRPFANLPLLVRIMEEGEEFPGEPIEEPHEN